jgi:uncharacterized protein YfkK (UPF0435 family)
MRLFRAATCAIFALLALSTIAVADDWKPISPEDLQLKEIPGAKGAHAAILYYEDVLNDKDSVENVYFRIKILSEEGKKYADIELPPYFGDFSVTSLKARTIRPDGSIVPFDGKYFTKVVAKRKEVKLFTKTFSIPDVQVGSIIEYRYNLNWDPGIIYTSKLFTLQHELFTRKAHAVVIPYDRYAYSYTWFGVRDNERPVQTHDRITLDAENLAAFEKEDYMPPEDELRARLVVFKRPQDFGDTEKFWKEEGKNWRNNTEKFLDKKNAMRDEVNGLLNGANTPEEKLRRIYERVQKIENLTYAPEKTEKELQREKRRQNNNVEDVLKNGYGYHSQINRLFVALARAAGFDATVVRVTERDGAFFHKNILSTSQLDSDLALVRVDGKELYLSPATPYCPFGLLPWEDTNVEGIRDDKDGISFVNTGISRAADTVMARKADLTLQEDGTLTGQITATFTGMEALGRRLAARDHDDVERKKRIEDEVKGWLPTAGSTAELISIDKWESTEPLVVKANVRIPGYAAGMGKRVLLPAYTFQTTKGHAFQKSRRVQPIYFRTPWTDEDEINIKLPEGLQVENLPTKRDYKNGPIQYLSELTRNGSELKIHRRFVMDNVYFDQKYYEPLQQVFNMVKAGDDEQVVLKTGSVSAAAK